MSRNEEHQSLIDFGKTLIREVRDKTIDEFEKLGAGEMKGVYGEYYRNLISSFGKSELEIINEIVTDVVDRTLHNFLWMLEQSPDFTVAAVQLDAPRIDLVELSDGLSGELYSERGWISIFSDKRESRMDELIQKRFLD